MPSEGAPAYTSTPEKADHRARPTCWVEVIPSAGALGYTSACRGGRGTTGPSYVSYACAVNERTRRSPKFTRFLATGAILGFLLGALWSMTGAPAAAYSVASQIGYFGLMGACLGALIAGIVAVLVDRGR